MKAVVLVSHGSQSPMARAEVEELGRQLRQRLSGVIVEMAFLEIESPDIPTGIARCVQQGADEIVVLLNFLNSGQHAGVDIPKIVNEAKNKYPKVHFRLTKPIGQHERLIDLFLDLIEG